MNTHTDTHSDKKQTCRQTHNIQNNKNIVSNTNSKHTSSNYIQKHNADIHWWGTKHSDTFQTHQTIITTTNTNTLNNTFNDTNNHTGMNHIKQKETHTDEANNQ